VPLIALSRVPAERANCRAACSLSASLRLNMATRLIAPWKKLLKSRVPMRTGASPSSGVIVTPPVADWSSRSLSRNTPSR
jgi:hypothetical protein